MRRFAKPVYGVNLYRGFESRPLRSNVASKAEGIDCDIINMSSSRG